MSRMRLVRGLSTATCAIFMLIVGFVFAMLSILGNVHARASETTDVNDGFKDVRSDILETLEKTGVASLVVAVAKDGEIVWERVLGGRIGKKKSRQHRIPSITWLPSPSHSRRRR